MISSEEKQWRMEVRKIWLELALFFARKYQKTDDEKYKTEMEFYYQHAQAFQNKINALK